MTSKSPDAFVGFDGAADPESFLSAILDRSSERLRESENTFLLNLSRN
jgi:hypothetical protein